MKIKKIFIIWLLLVIIWNFSFPRALPAYDVFVAIVLAFFFQILEDKI